VTRCFIGIDIGGTNTKIALVNDLGEINHLHRVFTCDVEQTAESLLNQVKLKTEKILHETNQPIEGIGIAIPGLQSNEGIGPLYSANLSMFNGFNIKKYFTDQYNFPVYVSNDLVAHSLAESQFGAGKGVNRFLSVSLGTGIGHTYIEHGTPVVMINGISGDSGRMILDPNSDICDSCGIYGSAEALCGVKAVEILATNLYGTGVKYSAQDIITAAREKNDPIAREILTIIAHRTAHLLMNLSSIYFPEVIALTGGQTESGNFFLQECQAEFGRLSSQFFNNFFHLIGQGTQIAIVNSKTRGLTGLIGSIVPLLV
jgi:glucokinase